MFAEGRRSITITADLNWRVLGFAVAVTLGAGLLSALFPAWRVFRSELEQVIREGQTRSSESRAASMLRQSLVASQVAVSLVLLVGAITFAGTLAKLRDLDPGFRNDRVLTMSVELPEGYLKAGKSAAVWRSVADAVRAIPDVKSASLATFTPLSQRDRWRPAEVRGYHARERPGQPCPFRSRLGRILRDPRNPGTPRPPVHCSGRGERAESGGDQPGRRSQVLRRARPARPDSGIRQSRVPHRGSGAGRQTQQPARTIRPVCVSAACASRYPRNDESRFPLLPWRRARRRHCCNPSAANWPKSTPA